MGFRINVKGYDNTSTKAVESYFGNYQLYL